MPLPIAVADTSVLISLHYLNLLPSLSLLYQKILVPAAVRVEFLTSDEMQNKEVALNVLTTEGLFSPCDEYDIIQVDLLRSLKMEGAEAEALSQLMIRQAEVLLIDEKIGRKVAEREMRKVQGTVGILAELHKLGLVDFSVAISRIRKETKFRISHRIVHQVLRESLGEKSE